MSNTEREARRRIHEACHLIRSAYRLETLVPQETIDAVKSAIIAGVEQQAADIAEETAAIS
jgi:hypothetical protein